MTGRGRHHGSFMGVEASGKDVVAEGIGIGRIVDGRIAESWAAYDALGLMRQIGGLPLPGQPSP